MISAVMTVAAQLVFGNEKEHREKISENCGNVTGKGEKGYERKEGELMISFIGLLQLHGDTERISVVFVPFAGMCSLSVKGWVLKCSVVAGSFGTVVTCLTEIRQKERQTVTDDEKMFWYSDRVPVVSMVCFGSISDSAGLQHWYERTDWYRDPCIGTDEWVWSVSLL